MNTGATTLSRDLAIEPDVRFESLVHPYRLP